MITDTNMDYEVARAVRDNHRVAEQVRNEARKRIPGFTLDALVDAETHFREADAAYGAATVSPNPVGDARERALMRLEWQEKLNDAFAVRQAAEQALLRARASFAAAERSALDAMLREAEVAVVQARNAIQAKVGGSPSADWANAMLAADPGLAVLLAEGKKADERLALLTKAVRTLYQ
jgi:hypothetical protein